MIKLVVYDWNGTLLADLAAIVEGINKELEIFGASTISPVQYRRLYEVPINNFFKKLGVSDETIRRKSHEAVQAFHAYYEPRVAKARTRSGTREVLGKLHSLGITQILLSNHVVEAIYLQLQRLHLNEYIEAVLANDKPGDSHVKGKKDRLVEYLKESHVSADEAMIVGDTVEETKIGKELGMVTVAISGGYKSIDRLKREKPDHLIHKVSDLFAKVRTYTDISSGEEPHLLDSRKALPKS